ncbi:MAG: UDP-N-acetylmuramoyl-L-alanine--D-glutamate ligase [Spirochaetaceae bacterium]|jgi:UDP-N-acetylmuramoylalanine--D-glutamate ligase|nr:UDP-N-acetylmuramoyl-L-alanine--D-glutamate ligase [Spirochaetaceae bacterium]
MTHNADFQNSWAGVKVLVMGLGLHGGGLSAAEFLLKAGASVTVTDLKDEEKLFSSVCALDSFASENGSGAVRYVLGRHEKRDFEEADVVIKNPGVRPDSPYLQNVKCIETDISIFLNYNPSVLIAVTGSKGKSFTASAICYALNVLLDKKGLKSKARLGGNITVSPLSFLPFLTKDDYSVLELSSFQLGDLALTPHFKSKKLLKPKAAVITSIMRDHQDRYGAMEPYIADKKLIYMFQDETDFTVCTPDEWGEVFFNETRGRGVFTESKEVWASLKENARIREINLLNARAALRSLGFDDLEAADALSSFTGVEHRMEFFLEKDGVKFYNDSAATIPEAAAACCKNLSPLILVTGGTDKKLDFTPLARACAGVKTVILLEGNGSRILAGLLKDMNTPYLGPFGVLEDAVKAALSRCEKGDFVALSPGCASFGMFQNEFDRGGKWKAAVKNLSLIEPPGN